MSPLVRAVPLPSAPVPQRAVDAIAADAHLPVCATCGTQFSSTPDGICPCCEDERQWYPVTGQEWTSLAELAQSRKHSLKVDTEDERIAFIECEPPFAINQTPILINTHGGHYIWDCQAPFTPALAGYLSSLQPALKAIAISHPHFYSTSLVWARALNVPLYICETDKEWFVRRGDIQHTDEVRFWTGRETLGPGVTLVQCGGHFPGSSILHWDRGAEPGGGPKTGLILVADTMMVRMDRRGFTFMWSYPNMIPLRPADAVGVVAAIDDLEYGAASSTWPNRMIRRDAKVYAHRSIERYLDATGWELEDGKLGGRLRPKARK
ncbi:hypothetical protein CC85DRAFT_307982 [Cutaneotrichosporon oleaginosum]|uniref:Metallo-beta-lactamase domain-containing protein n=1 Tax=Cutaneotrichosporon oleaginosum TaxID=879819 RepID=A0A0J1B4L6_9TREE|nr:uncharacterized protein CC85DRAFT_307982 [Cutaneotrichosporon oleaginosum]KLT42614.1 hypothetical protein CC85DRAFT_307982 [Cutaneotrichosporon oleaginosum]TXT05269.1 hypothetical protein COLE_06589 [Cutaneotrichosporon oleaginosum]